MKFDTMFVFDIVMMGLGIILIVQAMKMKGDGVISDWVLPQEEQKKCRKKEEYIRYMWIREMVFGLEMTLLGALGILSDCEIIKIQFWSYIRLVVFLGIFGVFYIQMMKARERFL